MKKLRKFKKNREEVDEGRSFSKSKKKKRLQPTQGKKKLLRHYFEEE